MKKIFILLLVLLLSACTPPKYDRKEDTNENYYEEYLISVGMVEYEEVTNMFDAHDMDDAYQFAGMEQTSSSFFIYHYLGTDEHGDTFHILMPDKVGEENIVIPDHMISFDELEIIITNYNTLTQSTEIDWAGDRVLTYDIILDESNLRRDVIFHLYTDRTINDKKVEADTEAIRDLLFHSLSSPFIYRIGNYYDGGNHAKSVFLAKGLNHDLIFILFDLYEIEVTILYTYNFD